MKSLLNAIKYWNIPKLKVKLDEGSRDNPTIVLLHGLAATSKTWDPLIKEIDTAKYRVIAVDLLGFGGSPAPKNIDYNVNQHREAIRKTIKSLGLRKPFMLVGHSMGSIISANYCKTYPKDVKHAILASLPLYLKEHQASNRLSKNINKTYLEAYKYFRNNPNITQKGALHIRKIFNIKDGIDITEKSWNSFSQSLKNTIEKQDTFNDIANSLVPITEIHGRLDEMIIENNMKKLNKLKDVEVITLSFENHRITPKFASRIYDNVQKIDFN